MQARTKVTVSVNESLPGYECCSGEQQAELVKSMKTEKSTFVGGSLLNKSYIMINVDSWSFGEVYSESSEMHKLRIGIIFEMI